MLDDGNLLVEFVVTSVSVSMSIRVPKDHYYTIISRIYVLVGDAVDCFLDGVMLVWTTSYTDEDSVTTIRDDVELVRMMIIPLHFPLLSWLLLVL